MPSSASALLFLFVSNFPVWTAFLLTVSSCHSSLSVSIAVAAAAASSSWSKNIERVVVVGGTHGNEYTGVWCIKAMDRVGPPGGPYPSLQISTLLGNPQAYQANRRFIDVDLNREFTHDKLHQQQEQPLNDEDLVGSEGLPLTVESLRAKELNALLGPKFAAHPPTDLIVDLHSTTSNMGTTIIIPEGDAVMAQAAAYVLLKCRRNDSNDDSNNNNNNNDMVNILVHPIPDRRHRPHLCSTGRHGFTIEVGPVPQGVLRHDAVERTQRALASLFEFLQRCNESPDERETVAQELKQRYPTGRVPCYLSAASARDSSKHSSGKISWPSDPDNPNFPAVLIHKSLQDKDFHKIRTGDVLFVDLDGQDILYDGSHGDEVYLIFVNEGGYYYASSGTGIGVAVDAEFDLDDGLLLQSRRDPSHEQPADTSRDKEL